MEKISEKDLYVFVFNAEDLPDSKYNEISDNKELYSDQLDQLMKMKEYLASFESKDIPSNLFQKIKEIEKGTDFLQKKILHTKEADYFIYNSKSKKITKKKNRKIIS